MCRSATDSLPDKRTTSPTRVQGRMRMLAPPSSRPRAKLSLASALSPAIPTSRADLLFSTAAALGGAGIAGTDFEELSNWVIVELGNWELNLVNYPILFVESQLVQGLIHFAARGWRGHWRRRGCGDRVFVTVGLVGRRLWSSRAFDRPIGGQAEAYGGVEVIGLSRGAEGAL